MRVKTVRGKKMREENEGGIKRREKNKGKELRGKK